MLVEGGCGVMEHNEICELCGCKLSQQSARYTYNYSDGSSKQVCMECFYKEIDKVKTVNKEGAE